MSLVVALTEPLGLPIGFPLVPFLNGILYHLVYNRKDSYFVSKTSVFLSKYHLYLFKKDIPNNKLEF